MHECGVPDSCLADSHVRPQIPPSPRTGAPKWKPINSSSGSLCETRSPFLLGPKFQTPRIAKRREQLAAAEAEVATLHGEMQGSGPGSGKRSDTIAATNLRVALRTQHMNRLSADGLLYLDGMPGIEDTLRLPPTRVADQKLVDAANGSSMACDRTATPSSKTAGRRTSSRAPSKRWRRWSRT